MSHNNLRGSSHDCVERILKVMCDMNALRELDLSHNTLGVSYGVPNNPKFQGRTPPICVLGDVMINSFLETLDISNNQMQASSAISIAHGVRFSSSLTSIDISGNPIGQSGMRLFMNAINENVNGNVEVKMKDINAEHKSIKNKGDAKNNVPEEPVFDAKNPDGKYTLNLATSYGQIILQNLLQCAEKSVAENEGKFDLK